EAMVRMRRDDDQIAGVDLDAHPAVGAVAHIEDAFAVDDEANLVQRVVVLLVELRADSLEVRRLARQRHLVLIDVAALALDPLDLGVAAGWRKAPVENSETAQIVSVVRMIRLVEWI